ncbi:hypothetical protein ACR79S_12845 [Sphingobacterium spiritivorum]|uniref:hypothetical protein n=1 Tax=Sphingobacterium spiritivorum TaxID=258 RepID=UPI003DA2440E
MRYIIFLLLFGISIHSYAQKLKIFVTREKSHLDYDGYLLRLKVIKDGKSYETKPGDYESWFYFLRNFDLKDRVRILKKLSKYFDDYSLCSKAVKAVFPRVGIPRTADRFSTEKKYSIAVEAMFLINWMIFGDHACFMSTYPILYNKKLEAHIAYNDVKSIKKMAAVYKGWIRKKEQGEKMSLYDIFQFNGEDIIWGGSGKLEMESTKIFFEDSFKMHNF